MNWLKENWFKAGILVAILIAAFSLAYSFVVRPQEQAAALEECLVKAKSDYILDSGYINKPVEEIKKLRVEECYQKYPQR